MRQITQWLNFHRICLSKIEVNAKKRFWGEFGIFEFLVPRIILKLADTQEHTISYVWYNFQQVSFGRFEERAKIRVRTRITREQRCKLSGRKDP